MIYMNEEFKYPNRQIIPRLLPFNKFNKINLFQKFVKPSNEEEIDNYKKILKDWKENQTPSYAIQLVATVKLLNLDQNDEYRSAVRSLIKTGVIKSNPHIAELLNEKYINNNTIKEPRGRENINHIRKIINIYPDNPILWIEIAYYHLIEGNIEKAEKCIMIALNLNNTNEYIVRSAARFFVHINRPDKALYVIRNSPSLLSNPNILSSEISISNAFDIKTKNTKTATSIINDPIIKNVNLSELKATIATFEFNKGKNKPGKKHINEALINPNENILAQAQFLDEKFDMNLQFNSRNIPCSYEVDCWHYYQEKNYKAVANQSEFWFYFQPFSARPAVFNSYIKTLFLEDYKGAIEIINTALKLSPKELMLLNNKAFSLAKINKIFEAEDVLHSIQSLKIEDKSNIAIIKATQGLIEYRKRNYSLGYHFYNSAVNDFKKLSDFKRQCMAMYHWSIEEKRYDKLKSNKILDEVKILAQKYNVIDIIDVLKIKK